jgi:hypothetical protein
MLLEVALHCLVIRVLGVLVVLVQSHWSWTRRGSLSGPRPARGRERFSTWSNVMCVHGSVRAW